jgi:hypothetical protein
LFCLFVAAKARKKRNLELTMLSASLPFGVKGKQLFVLKTSFFWGDYVEV